MPKKRAGALDSISRIGGIIGLAGLLVF